MYNLIFLVGYNTYYNRLLKKEDTVAAYCAAADSYGTYGPCNFGWEDGVNTTLTLGSASLPWDNATPDYVLVVEPVTNAIAGRWFVMDSDYQRNGQAVLTLHRDVVADSYNVIKNAVAYINKGMVDTGSNLIFADEKGSYNQVLKSRTQLQQADEDGNLIERPWLAVYWDTHTWDDDTPSPYVNDEIRFDFEANAADPDTITLSKTTVEGWNNTRYSGDYTVDVTIARNKGFGGSHVWVVSSKGATGWGGASQTMYSRVHDPDGYINCITNYNWGIYPTTASIDAYRYNGQLCKSGSGTEADPYRFYRINVELVPLREDTTESRYSTFGTSLTAAGDIVWGANVSTYKLTFYGYKQVVTLTEIEAQYPYSLFLYRNNTACADNPYKVMMLPYTRENLGAMTALWTVAGDKIYDIQVLPYAPDEVVNYVDPGSGAHSVRQAKLYRNGVGATTYMFACPFLTASSYTVDLPCEVAAPIDPIAFKREVCTSFYRLVSPNNAGAFDFNMARNRGINGFRAEITALPINPYINVEPVWGGIYGQSFPMAARGLVCQGNFSINRITSAWTTYENQNKNYQAIFNREIESLDLQNRIGRVNDIAGIASGVLSGAAAGAMGGNALVPGAVGAGVGAAVGAVTGIVGGALDLKYNEQLRDDAKDLRVDMFGYGLGNIKARPNTLTRATAFNLDSPLLVVLEHYACTDDEAQAFDNAIRFHGMQVGVTDTLGNWMENAGFLQATLLRCEGMQEDNHWMNAVAAELRKGIYIMEDNEQDNGE